MTSTAVPDDYELRRCTIADVDAVSDLLRRRTHPFDAEDFRLLTGDADAGPGWAVAVFERSSGRAVSTATLIDETLRLGTVALPAGQVELVATDAEHEGRGLSGAVMAWLHEESDRRSHVVQPMIGIPNYYRQFGYSYAMPIGSWRPLRSAPGPVDPGVTIRRSVPDDIDALEALHVAEQAAADVSMTHSPAAWRWIMAREGSICLTAERAGAPVGGARVLPPDEGDAIAELVATDDSAARSILAAIASDRSAVTVLDRPLGVAGRAIEPFLGWVAEADRDMAWYYVRVPGLVELLNRIRPVLQLRLTAAAPAPIPDQLLISSYRTHVVADVVDGAIREFRPGGALQAPVSRGGSGVPDDVWPTLLFGPFGALELERRVPDVLLGRQRDVMGALFPPMSADLATFYLPA